MKKYDIVVARYNEDIKWIKELDNEIFNFKIYNKGVEDIDIESIQLENLGRDPHSFVTYIVDNYDNLPEYVIFLQGDPFAHSNNVLSLINNHTDQPYVSLSDNVIDENIGGWYEHLVDTKTPDLYPNMVRYQLSDTASAILGDETPSKFTFAAGQQYIVNKKYILNRDIDFYKMVLERFKIDYVLPWHIERMWFNIWKF